MRTWIARVLIGIVTFWNLQASFLFIFSPSRFTQAYELSGMAGEAAIRGVGVLFLMWNIPYLFAVQNPLHYRLALYFASHAIGRLDWGKLYFVHYNHGACHPEEFHSAFYHI